MSSGVVIWWVRRDLRLRDNSALGAALRSGGRVLPVFVIDPHLLKGERFSLARLKFMLDGLAALDVDLRGRGSGLLVRQGDPEHILPQLVQTVGAKAVYANRDYSPYALRRDRTVEGALSVPPHQFDDLVLHAPTHVLKADGKAYTVYTPYKRIWLSLPKPPPERYVIPGGVLYDVSSLDHQGVPSLSELGFGETIDVPPAGENEAIRRLERFARSSLHDYGASRDILSSDPFAAEPGGTSGLSPYLRFGMLSPRQVYQTALAAKRSATAEQGDSIDIWISELAWREFYVQILYHFPHVLKASFRPEYERVEYRHAPDEFAAWQQGQTGYPIVDAGMRQLATTGWMHNRARMIVASFLTKDLLTYWRDGETYFMRHLIDGDPAANNGGWQWSAGTGTDAQPYFRIFNPVSQSMKFDPHGDYIRRWIPELRDVPDELIHQPWKMDAPPRDYPPPIVEHQFARERTLRAFKAIQRF